MKPPGPEGTPRIDVSCEELEALLEGARAALGEAGYQKLQAADPHSGLCDRVTTESGGDVGLLAPIVVSLEHGEDQ